MDVESFYVTIIKKIETKFTLQNHHQLPSIESASSHYLPSGKSFHSRSTAQQKRKKKAEEEKLSQLHFQLGCNPPGANRCIVFRKESNQLQARQKK